MSSKQQLTVAMTALSECAHPLATPTKQTESLLWWRSPLSLSISLFSDLFSYFLLVFLSLAILFYEYCCVGFAFYLKSSVLLLKWKLGILKPFKAVPLSLGVILPLNCESLESSLQNLLFFVRTCADFGVKTLRIFHDSSCLIPKEYSAAIKRNSIKPVCLVSFEVRQKPELKKIDPSMAFEEFMESNSNPIDLMLFYERPWSIYGVPPLSVASSEFCLCAWSHPFTLKSLLFALDIYSKCDRRFGK